MEHQTVGKSRPYELTGEPSDSLMVRFLIHFLFVEHNSRMIELFDGQDAIFKLLENAQALTQKPMGQLKPLESPVKRMR